MHDSDIVIINGARTPIGRFGGSLKDLTVIDLAVTAMTAAMENSKIYPDQINEVIMGHSRQAGCGPNAPRIASVKSGIPDTVPAYGIQMACIAGMKSIMLAADSIRLGRSDIVLAGGMEHHSSVPYLAVNQRWGSKVGDVNLVDAMFSDGYKCGIEGKLMGDLTDDLALKYEIARTDQELFSLDSQMKYQQAKQSGFYKNVIAPIEIKKPRGNTIIIDEDECPREDTSLEGLAKLRPSFNKTGTITAGTSPPISDAACCVIVTSYKKAKELNLRPLGTIKSYEMSAVEAKSFGLGPIEAFKNAVTSAELVLEDIKLIEINEAFAAQVIALSKELDIDTDRLNVNGGSVAMGHPTGMSGARLPLELLYALNDHEKQFGIAGICGNGGHGAAMVLERFSSN